MKNSRFFRNLTLIMMLIVVSAWLPARALGQVKVAIVNSQKAFDQSLEGKKAVAILQEREELLKAELKKMDEAIKALKQKLDSQSLTLNPEARKELQQEIDRKEADRQKYEQENSRNFEQFKSQLIKRIREEMLAVIDELIRERGFELVFDLSTSGLIHYKPELDITDEVIKRYDAGRTGKR